MESIFRVASYITIILASIWSGWMWEFKSPNSIFDLETLQPVLQLLPLSLPTNNRLHTTTNHQTAL